MSAVDILAASAAGGCRAPGPRSARRVAWALGLVAWLGAVAASPAQTVEPWRYDQRGASGVCAPSLPVHAASLRARPLGLVNEGTGEVFVTCTFVGSEVGGRTTERITVNIGSTSPTSVVATCTLVNGFASGSSVSATYTPRSVRVGQGLDAFIEWKVSDLPGNLSTISRAAVQCRLPPRTTLQYIGTRYLEDLAS